MNKIKRFFGNKAIGFYFDLATLVFMLLSLCVFSVLAKVSYQIDEKPEAITAFCIVAMVVSVVAGYKDWFRAVTLLNLVFTSAALFTFVYGRVSYVVYYFAGDIMETGLSPLFILCALFLILGLVSSVLAICFKQEKSSGKPEGK